MALREVITLNESTPQLEAPQAGDSYLFPREVTIAPAGITTGIILSMPSADALTTGSIVRLISNSLSTAGRSLALIHNDNPLAVNATALELIQDAVHEVLILEHNGITSGSSYVNFKGTTAADVAHPISTRTTSGATTHHIQVEINGAKAWIAVSTNGPS